MFLFVVFDEFFDKLILEDYNYEYWWNDGQDGYSYGFVECWDLSVDLDLYDLFDVVYKCEQRFIGCDQGWLEILVLIEYKYDDEDCCNYCL